MVGLRIISGLEGFINQRGGVVVGSECLDQVGVFKGKELGREILRAREIKFIRTTYFWEGQW